MPFLSGQAECGEPGSYSPPRSIYGWFVGMASVLADRGSGSRGARKVDRVQVAAAPGKGAVHRGSSDAEQLGEFGLGVGAERVPMIGRRQDVKKRRTSAGASSVCCAN